MGYDLNTTEASAGIERMRDALCELNVVAYSAAKAVRTVAPESPLAAELKALALRTDQIIDEVM